MKKALKIIFLTCGIVFIILLSFFVYALCITKDVKLDKNKLINLDRTVQYCDMDGNIFAEESNGVSVTENNQIPDQVKKAFISVEDKRFYNHNGVDIKGIFRATVNNIKTLSLKEGASTISQQLIKNTHLNSEKTFNRKIKEIKLTLELEHNFSKDEILEKYLNTIYFGNNCYGITSASKRYFNKSPSELNLNESAALAGIIKAPSNYSPINNLEKCNERKNLVLKKMLEQNYITKADYDVYSSKIIEISHENQFEYDYLYLARNELNDILKNNPYSERNIKVITSFDKKANDILRDKINDFSDIKANKSAILMDKFGKIIAYYSTCGDVYRQIGSTIKPIAVYAPAIENDIVNSYTYILDEKTDFNGYSPSNYNNEYRGYISVKDSLAKSSNVCAVKLLNYLGLNKAQDMLSKMDMPITDEDLNLSLALGASKKGAKLSQITACYNIFSNDGYYSSPTTTSLVKSFNNNMIYRKSSVKNKVIQTSTASIMNDMLMNVVENGTAKKLSYTNIPLYAKTGTVGNDNGNSDAYTISYNSDYTLGVWFGNVDGELLDNVITGGNAPALLSTEIWKEFYKDKKKPKEIESKDVYEIYLDKISYENDKKLVVSDENAPERYKFKGVFKNKQTIKDKSNRFSKPIIEKPKITVNNNEIMIQLCLTEYYNAMIFKAENGKKTQVYDSKNNEHFYVDKLKYSTTYQYSVIPYFENNSGEKFFGDEIFIDKIKMPNGEFGNEWWKNDFE